MKKKKKKRRITPKIFLLFWAVLILSFIAGISIQLEQFEAYNAQAAHIRSLIEAEGAKNAALNLDKSYYESDAFIEKIAREQLNLIRPDEILFYYEDE